MSCVQYPDAKRPIKGSAAIFKMTRSHDESGVSGVGEVLEGIVFRDDTVAVHWLTDIWSVTFFPDFDTFLHLHIFSHPSNGTTLWFDQGVIRWDWTLEPPDEA